jgi:hypothetical protein
MVAPGRTRISIDTPVSPPTLAASGGVTVIWSYVCSQVPHPADGAAAPMEQSHLDAVLPSRRGDVRLRPVE